MLALGRLGRAGDGRGLPWKGYGGAIEGHRNASGGGRVAKVGVCYQFDVSGVSVREKKPARSRGRLGSVGGQLGQAAA